MTSSSTSSKLPLDPTPGPFYEAPFQNTITAGTGWDKNLSEILHSKSRMPYSASKEIASAYAELLRMLETSNGSLVGFYCRSDLKQILFTAENYVRFSKWYQEDSLLDCRQLLNDIRSSRIWFHDRSILDFSKFRDQSKIMSSKIETEISLLRDRTGLEQQFKNLDNRRLLTFITYVSKILAEVSIGLFAFTTLLAVVLPWHWRFIISKVGLALAIGTIAYLGFDTSKRMERYVLAVQSLYMHYFLFIWNDLKACLTHIAEKDVPISDRQIMGDFLWTFQASFFGNEEELQRLQMQISASLTADTKKWFEW